ncbi:MAG TPA: hypothetical protein VIL48_22200 [Acidimicrobiales bacterium]
MSTDRTVPSTGAGDDIALGAAPEVGRLGFPVVAAVPCPSLEDGVHRLRARLTRAVGNL